MQDASVCKAGVTDPPDMKQSMIEKKREERVFLEQLLDGSKIENYNIEVPIKADLRKYQQVCEFTIISLSICFVHYNNFMGSLLFCVINSQDCMLKLSCFILAQ